MSVFSNILRNQPKNDLSLHCTDFFLERRNRSYYLHCLEEVDLQTMEIIRSVSSFEKNPYNVSSNLSLSRAHFSKVHVFCEVHGGRGGCGGHSNHYIVYITYLLDILTSMKPYISSTAQIAHL